jgi:hypothetical protein
MAGLSATRNFGPKGLRTGGPDFILPVCRLSTNRRHPLGLRRGSKPLQINQARCPRSRHRMFSGDHSPYPVPRCPAMGRLGEGCNGCTDSGAECSPKLSDYSAESKSHEITLVTDQDGHVVFPSQYRAASLLQRAFYTTRSALGGAHASFGNHAFVFVFGRGYEGDAVTGPNVTDWTGRPSKMTSAIIAEGTAGSR